MIILILLLLVSIYILYIYIQTKRKKLLVKKLSNALGLSFSLDNSQKIMKLIRKNYDIKVMSKYADMITIKNAQNVSFLENQVGSLNLDNISVSNINPTSFGNLAYISLYSPKQYSQKTHTYLLELIKIDSTLQTQV